MTKLKISSLRGIGMIKGVTFAIVTIMYMYLNIIYYTYAPWDLKQINPTFQASWSSFQGVDRKRNA